MNILLTSIFFLFNQLFFIPLDNPTSNESKDISWETTSRDFGNVVQGSKLKHEFIFTNKSAANIEIKSAQASCGCTVPTFSKDPVASGKQGSVTAVFDTSNKEGNQTKSVTVETNVGTFHLTISCFIVKEESKPKSPVRIGD